MKRKYENKRAIYKFKKDYTDGKIRTKVLSNLLCNFKNADLDKIANLIYNRDKHRFLSCLLFLEGPALRHYFGKRDFMFEGNRKYYNYIMEVGSSTFIVGGKTEVLLDDNLKVNYSDVILYYKEMIKLIADFITETKDTNPEPFVQEVYQDLLGARASGILDNDNMLIVK